MTQKSVFFYSEGSRILGVLHVPKTLKKGRRLAAVVVCYGYCDFMDDPWVVEICERLNRIGVVALRFDYRGNGASEGLRGRIICSDEVKDVQSAVTFLETKSEVDEGRIGLVGYSLGGANVSYLSAIDDRVKCTVSIAGVSSGERWLHECFRLNRSETAWKEFLELLHKDRKIRVKTGKSRFVDALEVMPSPPDVVELTLEARKMSHPPRSLIDRVPLETGESIINYKPENFASTIRCPRVVDPWRFGYSSACNRVEEHLC